ncbi:Uncharacterised protein [Mycobacterium tuberculosis]|nr:Uncharacterised protein [Mycobacterium tuberculosis]
MPLVQLYRKAKAPLATYCQHREKETLATPEQAPDRFGDPGPRHVGRSLTFGTWDSAVTGLSP